MKRRQFVKSVGVITSSLIVAGCTGGSSAGNPNREDEEFFDLEGGIGEKSEGNLKITDRRLFKTAHGIGVMGTVKNTGQDVYTHVEVRVILADENNNPIQTFNKSIGRDFGQSIDTEAIDGLGPGEIWKFAVLFENVNLENVESYRVIVSGEVA